MKNVHYRQNKKNKKEEEKKEIILKFASYTSEERNVIFNWVFFSLYA